MGCQQAVTHHRRDPRHEQVDQAGQINGAHPHPENDRRRDGQREQQFVVPALEQAGIAGKGAGQHAHQQRREPHGGKIQPVQPGREQHRSQRQGHARKAEHEHHHQHGKQQRIPHGRCPGPRFAGLAAAEKGRAQFPQLLAEQCTDHHACASVPSSSRKTSSRLSSPRTSSMEPARTSRPARMMATRSQSFSATSST